MIEDRLLGVGANETAEEGSCSPADGGSGSQAGAEKAAEERMKKAKEETAVLLELRLVDLLKQMRRKEFGDVDLVAPVVDTADVTPLPPPCARVERRALKPATLKEISPSPLMIWISAWTVSPSTIDARTEALNSPSSEAPKYTSPISNGKKTVSSSRAS